MRLWLLEFNVSPSLKDPKGTNIDDAVMTHELHDSALIASALHIAIPWEGGSAGLWDLCSDALDAAATAALSAAAAYVAATRPPPPQQQPPT
eukprot:gene23913-65975_t